MAQLAPELPSTEMLHAMHPLSDEAIQKVSEKRHEVAMTLQHGRKLFVALGCCAMTNDIEKILDENRQITEFGEEHGITVVHRVPPWKPRTDPEAWHGLDTSDPEIAHQIATAIAEQSGNLAMEFGHPSHVGRFAKKTTLGWRGSRNDTDSELLTALRASDATLPIAIKNGMDGHVETALGAVKQLSVGREAPAILLFRGGEDFTTEESWNAQHQSTLIKTGGSIITDVAHGGEMAHHPDGMFAKSVLGQLACLQSVISTANTTGLLPRGVMIEASNIPSPTDPVVPLEQAFEKLEELAFVHRQITR